jgi:hypothetical protein
VERVIKVGAEVVGTPPQRPQVRAAHVAYEQRVARENSLRLCRVLPEIEVLLAICTQSARFCDCVFCL